MNLFSNIFDQFTGQAQPQVPSFATPQAPRTTNYTQPIVTPTKRISTGFAPGYENTVDETQSPLFKGVQGAANLFTGIKSGLQETAQSDIDRKQQEMDQKGIKFADHLISKGYTKEQVFASLDELKKAGELQVSPNFSERFVGNIANRMGEVQRTTERLANEPIATRLATGIPSYAGDVVGTAFEPITAAVSPILSAGIKKIGAEGVVQDLGSQWEEIRKQYPNIADTIEGVANVSQLFPLSPKVTAPLKQGLKTAGVKTLETAKQVAPYIKPNLSKQAKKLTSQADMGFRKQAEDIAVPKLSEMGMREKQKVIGDVIETKPGFFKKEELVRSPQESLAIEEVSRMLKEGKIKKGGTELQKSVAISDEITGLAEALKGRLDNTPNPVNIPKADVNTLLDTISQNIDRNPFLKAGELDRSAQQIIKNIREQLTKDTYTPSELLDIRKQLDSDIKTYKGEKAFSPDIENAFSTTLRDIRQGINNKISDLVPDAEVRSFLDRQSALYTARDNVDLKWSKQANSLIGRTLTKIQSATGIPRTEIIELSTALGLLGASSLAPIVAPIAIGATAIAGGRKLVGAILSPKNKTRLAEVIEKLDKAIKKNPKDAELVKAKELFSNPTKNGITPTNIRNSSNNRPSNSQSVETPVSKPLKPSNESKILKPTPKGDNTELQSLQDSMGLENRIQSSAKRDDMRARIEGAKKLIKPKEKISEGIITKKEAIAYGSDRVKQYDGSFGNGYFQIVGKHSGLEGASNNIKNVIENSSNVAREKVTIESVGKTYIPEDKLSMGSTGLSKDTYIKLSNGDVVNKKYFDKVMKEYPNSEVYGKGNNGPVVFKIGDKAVGIVMPIKVGENTKFIIKPKPLSNESKGIKPVIVPKKTINTPIVKKSGVKFTNPVDGKVQDPMKIPYDWASYTTAKKNEYMKALNEFNDKPITPPSNAKQSLNKPKSIDTIPEGYFKNAFGEIIKKPSNAKGGFIKIPEIGKKTPVNNPLVEEARKYKSGRNMYDVMPYGIREKFDRIGVYSLKHFEDFYKKNITNTKGEITMYRGQSKPGKQVQFNDTKFQGNTDGGVFFTPSKEVARKYGENIIELKSNKNNTLSYKEAEKLQKMAEKIVKKDIINGIQSKPIIEQMALGRPKAFAEYTKKQFLETGDMFGEQGEMIFYKEFNKPIVKPKPLRK